MSQATSGTTALFRSHEDAPLHAYEGPDGRPSRIYDYFGGSSGVEGGPQAYLVDYPAGRETRAHFHPVDQFQIFFGTPGSYYQRHQIPSVMVHYSDAFTTYGPFGAHDDGMRFFTLRPRTSEFTAYMPEDRERLQTRGQGRGHFQFHAPVDVASQVDTVVSEEILSTVPGGPLIRRMRAPAERRLVIRGASPNAGWYVCVLSGNVTTSTGEALGAFGLGWCGSGATETLVVGGTGCDLLVLGFSPSSNPARPTSRGDGPH